jgi:hypothetical protein
MKSKVISNGIVGGSVNPQVNNLTTPSSGSQFTKELPNIQARSIAGGITQNTTGQPASAGGNGTNTAQPTISNYAGLSAYLQNGKSPKNHIPGG